MGVVIKLAGVNGSGKTTLTRAVMGLAFDVAPVEKAGKKILAYHGDLPKDWQRKNVGNLYVLGSYETTCGGMDTINDQATKSRLVRKYAAIREGLVLFEGILTGVTYGEFGLFSETPAQDGHWLYAFMGTPYEICVRRVVDRRAFRAEALGKEPKPFDPERTMRPKLRALESVRARAEANGHRTVIVPWDLAPVEAAKFLLKEAKKLI